MVTFGGEFTTTTALTSKEWGICLALASLSWPLNFILCMLPAPPVKLAKKHGLTKSASAAHLLEIQDKQPGTNCLNNGASVQPVDEPKEQDKLITSASAIPSHNKSNNNTAAAGVVIQIEKRRNSIPTDLNNEMNRKLYKEEAEICARKSSHSGLFLLLCCFFCGLPRFVVLSSFFWHVLSRSHLVRFCCCCFCCSDRRVVPIVISTEELVELPSSMAKLRWVKAINNMVITSNVVRTWRGGRRLSAVFNDNAEAGEENEEK